MLSPSYEHARRRRMYITYRAREKLRAFTCTCGAREAQLAARDVHLSLHACIDASAHARHTHTHVCMTLTCMNMRVSHIYMAYMHVNQIYNRHVHVRKVERMHVYLHVYLSLTTPEDAL